MKYCITFYFPNNTTRSFHYRNLDDIYYDLNFDLSLHVNSCLYYNIIYMGVNYE